ncbi:MAG: GTPase ObgE [Candidatus Methylomirabilales bacterium]
MFVDVARITVRAGDGGHGCIAFRREKFVPRGGPSGGDGGRGGHILVEASSSVATLLDQKYRRSYRAQRGAHGSGKNRRGKDGADLVIRVPIGTVVLDDEAGEVLADLDQEGACVLAARGGRGGRGNARLATPTNQAPREAEDGKPGEERVLRLELKLLADVGLVGPPNAGKSTLLQALTAARPKIADYPFTTLVPNLGVLEFGSTRRVTLADVPGLIEGAAEGAGLGHQFLRHIERVRLILFILDVSAGGDPVAAYGAVAHELEAYGGQVASLPRLVVGNKVDLPDAGNFSRLEDLCRQQGLACFPVSARTGEGLEALVAHLEGRLLQGMAAVGGSDGSH